MTDSEKLDFLINEFCGMKTEMQSMKAEIGGLKDEMKTMKSEMQTMNDRIGRLEKDVKRINLTLENETNRNIKTIAEGHTDLSRRLYEALRLDNEKEMLLVRVTVLENELQQIKDTLTA